VIGSKMYRIIEFIDPIIPYHLIISGNLWTTCQITMTYQLLTKRKIPHVNNVCKMIGYHCSYLQVWTNLQRRCEGTSVTNGCWFTSGIYFLTFTPNPTSLKGKKKLFSRPTKPMKKIIMGWPFWVDIRAIRKVTLSLPSLWASFQPFPLFSAVSTISTMSVNFVKSQYGMLKLGI